MVNPKWKKIQIQSLANLIYAHRQPVYSRLPNISNSNDMRVCSNTTYRRIIAWSNGVANYPRHQSAVIPWNDMVLKQDAEDKRQDN